MVNLFNKQEDSTCTMTTSTSSPSFKTLGGVYHSQEASVRGRGSLLLGRGSSHRSSTNARTSTTSTTSSSSRSNKSRRIASVVAKRDSLRKSSLSFPGTANWKSSGRRACVHHRGAPALVRKTPSGKRIRPEEEDNLALDLCNSIDSHSIGSGCDSPPFFDEDELILGRIIDKSKQLLFTPGALSFANNLLLVNGERVRNHVAPLLRAPHLDDIAKEHAEAMAEADQLHRCTVRDVTERIKATTTTTSSSSSTASSTSFRRIGINVASGMNLKSIHHSMIHESLADLNNILDRRFVYMGVGTCKSKKVNDDTLYVCQIFQG